MTSSPFTPRRILVTGGGGYVGSALLPHLLGLGHTVRTIDLLLYTDAGIKSLKARKEWDQWSKRFELVQGDLRDESKVRAALKGCDTVIHLAAISNDPTGELDESLTRQVNFDAVGMLLALAREAGVTRFINASSSSVFGIKDVPDVTEELEVEPLTFYSKYKSLSEWLVITAASSNFCAVNIRPATICGYSPRQRFDLTVNKLTADAVRKGVITVHGGKQRRPNVGMSDAINLYGLLTQTDPKLINGQTFNFGFENHTVMKIAEIIQEEVKDLGVSINVTDTNDPRDYHISSAKLVKYLGYQPVSSIREEVANLRAALDRGEFPDIDADDHYNMKCMKLARDNGAYKFLARPPHV